MISPLFTIANFSPKIEWLADQSAGIPANGGWSDLVKWIWKSLPDYTPLPTEYSPSLMTEDDVVEEERLMNQDKLMAFLNVWLSRMVEEDNSMREKVALFWHHHIPCGTGHKVDHVRLLLEIYREYGLGNLRDLLVAVAANPAMMYFLDGHHAHKDNPNENFSRELMEIFNLGEGAYTLQDVKKAERAFT